MLSASFTLEDIINPTFRVDLRGFSTFVNLDVLVSGSRTFEVPFFKSPPGFLNAAIPGVGSIGLILSLNLVVDLSATLDINGGFFVRLPEDAFVEASIFGGGDLSGTSL